MKDIRKQLAVRRCAAVVVSPCVSTAANDRCCVDGQDIQRKLGQCEMTALCLGQDRDKRKYWVVARDFSRIYVQAEVCSE
jgi:hypothetical protein